MKVGQGISDCSASADLSHSEDAAGMITPYDQGYDRQALPPHQPLFTEDEHG